MRRVRPEQSGRAARGSLVAASGALEHRSFGGRLQAAQGLKALQGDGGPVEGVGVSEISTALAGARGFKRHPLAPDPHPRSMQGMNTSYDCRKSSVTTGRKNGAGQLVKTFLQDCLTNLGSGTDPGSKATLRSKPSPGCCDPCLVYHTSVLRKRARRSFGRTNVSGPRRGKALSGRGD